MPNLPKTKNISYHGGIVAFAIPSHWREEYEASGGAMFYEDRPDSGTLRLNVLSFESAKDMPPQELALSAFPPGSFELLPNGFPVRHTVTGSQEGEELLHIHRWEIAVPIPPRSLRMVIFQHTILASQESDPAMVSKLIFLRQSIRSAQFSQQAGTAGNYPV